MSIIFFEGFETIGPETGFANRNLVLPRLRQRMDAHNNLSDNHTSNMFLVEGENGLGHAWKMGQAGSSFANSITIPLPDHLKVTTGPEAPTFVIGVLVFIPADPRNFSLFTLNVSGASNPNLRVENSSDLVMRIGAGEIERAEDVLKPGFWNYVEWKIKADGTIGQRGVAVLDEDITDHFDDPEAENITGLDIRDVEMYQPLWSSTATYTEGDIVRWKGFEYEAQEVIDPEDPPEILTNQGKEPEVEEEGFWDLIGVEQPDSVTEVPFASSFYFMGDPAKTQYVTNSFASGTHITFTPSIGPASYLPEEGEELVFGNQGKYGVSVRGDEDIADVERPTMAFNNSGIMQSITMGSVTSDTGNNFVAYDDIYLVVVDEDPNSDYLGPVRVFTLPPNTTIQNDWDPSIASDNHADLVKENGVNYATYISSEENDWEEEFGHVPISDSGDLGFVVKVEVEAQNLTAGDPTLRVGVHLDSEEFTEEFPIENTGDPTVTSTIVPNKPGGGEWTIPDINNSTIHLQIFSGFGGA